jgi:LuxR family maltose regulon positive regulatory protein
MSRRALERLQETAFPALRSIAALTLGHTCLATGAVAEAQQALLRSAADGKAAGHNYVTVNALLMLAEVKRRQAHLPSAAAIYRRALRLVNALPVEGQQPLLAGAYLGLGYLAYEWNKLAEAAETAARAFPLCQASGEAGTVVRCHILLALVHQAQGDLAAMAHTLQQAEVAASQGQSPREIARVMAWQARYWLYAHHVARAAMLAQQAAAELETAGYDPSTFSMTQEVVALTSVRVYLAQGKPGVLQALPILKRWQQFARSAGLTALASETFLLQAQAYQLLGDTSQAQARLAWALRLAEPGGYVRLFLDEGPLMAGLLRELAAQGATHRYAGRLLETSPAQPPVIPGASGLMEPLTPRQQEILTLLVTGMSNREIARQLVISVETVRWHTKQIFRRLNVRNRTEAAARAHNLPSF